jgi:exodeoxyribonuclease VII small subunit
MSNPHPAEPAFWARQLGETGRHRRTGDCTHAGAVGQKAGPVPGRLECYPQKEGVRHYVGAWPLTTIALSQNEMSNSSLSASAADPATYEDALAELERLVAAMEAGQLPLDQLLHSYKRGAELLNFCRGRLEAVEQQVKVLEDGQLRPWTEV